MTVSLLILRIKFVFFYNPTLFYEQLLHFTIDELTSFEILAILLIQYILYSVQYRVGNSFYGFSSESLVFCEQKSNRRESLMVAL